MTLKNSDFLWGQGSGITVVPSTYTPGHSTPVYFTSSVLANRQGCLQLPLVTTMGPGDSHYSPAAGPEPCAQPLLHSASPSSVIWILSLPRIIQGETLSLTIIPMIIIYVKRESLYLENIY